MTVTYLQSDTYENRIAASVAAVNGANGWVVEAGATPLIRKAHMGKIVSCTLGTAVALTLPRDSADPSIAIGDSFRCRMDGAGQVTITAGAGVTLRKAGATAKILAIYGEVVCTKIAADTWAVNGELAAS